jgi:amidase
VSELCFTAPRRLARMLRNRQVSATELMRAFIAQIERINPQVNAIVTFLPEQALKAARALERRNKFARPLDGLPIAYKDLLPTKGIRTTFGSTLYADHVPVQDHSLVERLCAAGAITLGKTNTPEFGAGSHTFNAVFGATRNPYDLSKTCGGSSGGAAVSVACGMLPFADGSDLAASLRNPGNFCNVVGFRPTPGRVPSWPAPNGWDTLSTLGPIARTVEDTAFLLCAMAGPDPRAPASMAEPGTMFGRSLKRDFRRTRIAWSRDLGGLPVEPGVTAVLDPQRTVFRDLGCIVEEAEPDLSPATEAFHTLRALGFLQRYGSLLKEHRGKLKETVIWNIEQGLRLTPEQITRGQALRTEVFHRLRAFLERYEFLLCPVNQVLPFAIDLEYPTEIAGVKMENYIDWMKSCYYISVASHPAISVPAGFSEHGLPAGLQIVGRYRDDFGVLQLAHAFEQQTKYGQRRPPLAVE